MTDYDSPSDSEAPKSSRFNLITIILILLALAGAYVSLGYSRTLSDLRRQQNDFEKQFGDLKIEDPSKVAIVAVPSTAAQMPPWVTAEDVWIFRVRIPANYATSFSTTTGKVAADSPLTTSSGGGGSDSASPEAREFQLVISTSKNDETLKVNLFTQSGSTALSPPKELNVDSMDELVLETIMEPGDPMRTFTADEAILIWKLRSKTPSDKMLNHTKLYPSCAIYMYESAQRTAFKRLQRGKSSSMEYK